MSEPSRIKEIPEHELTKEQRAAAAGVMANRGKLPAPFKIWFHSPALATAWATLGNFLHKQGSLKDREVWLVICIMATHWNGEYVWIARRKDMGKRGFAQSDVDAILAGKTPEGVDERERAVCDLARAAMGPDAGPDEVFNRAERLLDRNGIAEVLALMGYYTSVSMGMRLHRAVRTPPAAA